MNIDWRNDRRCAISLTFDDGLESQLALAIPALEERSFRGTFYLMTADDKKLDRFVEPQGRGHEIGNHSIRHVCTGSVNMDSAYYGLERMTLEDMAEELDESDRRMREKYPGAESFSFGYPCYNTFVGRGSERRSYVPLVSERFAAARGGGEISTSFNSPETADVHCLNSWKCERKNASELIGIVERTVREGAYSVLTFHGISEGHLSVFLPDFIELVDYLHSRRDVVWTAPLLEVATHIRAFQAAKSTR